MEHRAILTGIHVDFLEARVHQRPKAANSEVEVGLEDVALGFLKVESDASPYAITYKHSVVAKSKDGKVLYQARVGATALFESDTEFNSETEGLEEFVMEGLRMAMPATAQKLRELCFDLGISPVPEIPLVVTQVVEAADENARGEP